MKIKRISPKTIKHLTRRHCKNELLYTAIRNLPIGGALKIILDKPIKWFPTLVYQNFRKERTGYCLHIFKQDHTNKIFALLKNKTKGNKNVNRNN